MKDALGHGSNSSGRTDLPHNKIALAPGARFTGRRVTGPPVNHVAELRARLAAPKQGLLHSFMQGVKDAIGAGRKLG